MEPLRLGAVPLGLGTADMFLTVEDETGPRLRIDLYSRWEEHHVFEEVQLWSGRIVLGWGERLYLVDPEARQAVVIDLGSCFGHLYLADDYLLVGTGDCLIRVQPDGTVRWTSDALAIDGVIVEEVTHGIIHGAGEWDPPGGWQSFRLSLETGQPV
jgi:hypothetical protein